MFTELFEAVGKYELVIKMKYATSNASRHSFRLDFIDDSLKHETRLMDRRINTTKIELVKSALNSQNVKVETWEYTCEVEGTISNIGKKFKDAKKNFLNIMGEYANSQGTNATVSMKIKKIKA